MILQSASTFEKYFLAHQNEGGGGANAIPSGLAPDPNEGILNKICLNIKKVFVEGSVSKLLVIYSPDLHG